MGDEIGRKLTISLKVEVPDGLREREAILHVVEYVLLAIKEHGLTTTPVPDPFHYGLKMISCRARGREYELSHEGRARVAGADQDFVPEGAVERTEPWGD